MAHQLDHVTGASQEGSTLCDSHDLLGTVLGVAAASAPAHELLSLGEARTGAPAASAPEQRALSPKSRGPPTVS